MTPEDVEASRLLRQETARKAAARRRETEKALGPEEIAEGLRLTASDLEEFRELYRDPPRNAMAKLQALKLMLEYSQPKPKQEVGVEGGLRVTVRTFSPAVTDSTVPLVEGKGDE